MVKREKNLIVGAGLNYLASLLVNENTNDMSIYLAYGTGNTPAAAGDTKLQTEGGRKNSIHKDQIWGCGKAEDVFL